MANAAAATRRRKNGHSNNEVQTRLSALRADLDALQHDMRALVSDVGEVASEQVHEAVNGAMESASEAVERVEEWGNENLEPVREAVRTQPLAACMISMSAGAIIGALLLR
ncbi:MAG TPA: hypothetical protein VK479_15255 [Micropepsaceae bacterium]|nr:hypothetical protein [Micropepsaceae bacterium]